MGWELEKPASFFLGVVDFFSRGWSLSMPPMGGGVGFVGRGWGVWWWLFSGRSFVQAAVGSYRSSPGAKMAPGSMEGIVALLLVTKRVWKKKDNFLQ